MKNPFINNPEIRPKRPPLPINKKDEKKFVYSKQKFSSPQFFFKSTDTKPNNNILNGIISSSPKRTEIKNFNYQKQQDTLIKVKSQTKIQTKINDIKRINDNNQTPKKQPIRQIQQNDTFYPSPIPKSPSHQHHNFQILQKSPNHQNCVEKASYIRHKRFNSQPTQFKTVNVKAMNTQRLRNKNVKFNDQKLHSNLLAGKRQVKKQLDRSLSDSILKNKCKKTRVNSLQNILRVRQQSRQEDDESVVSIEVNDELHIKQASMNTIIQKKYQTLLSSLKTRIKQSRVNQNIPTFSSRQLSGQVRQLKEVQKYTDTIFPPTFSSIFGSLNPHNNSKGDQLKWIRITQLFPNNKIVVYSSDSEAKSNIVIGNSAYGSQALAAAINAIKNCRVLMQKMFLQQQKINEFGIYIVKIFHQNIWKFVIIDDKIPVISKKNYELLFNKTKKGNKHTFNSNIQSSFIPAFLNISLKKKSQEPIEIWPFLLEKAYSNYYASYETFHLGNQIDYLEEITGSPSNYIDFQAGSQLKENFLHIQKQLQGSDSFALGQVQQNFPFIPIISNKFKHSSLHASNKGQNGNTKQNQNSLIYYDPVNSFNQCNSVYEKLPTLFNRIHLFSFGKFQQVSSSIIGHYQSAHGSGKQGQKVRRAQISCRSFTLNVASKICISVRQKQKRFYENSSFKYDYMWIRVILIQREFNGECRWVMGKYDNRKSINFQTFLTEGEFFLVVIPEWRQTHCHELGVFLWSDGEKRIKIQKMKYNHRQKMVEKACMDLAQRMGKLSQINAFICSYNYLNEEVGMIIENINNERTVGTVKVMRSINGLKAEVQIVPFNRQFYQLSQQQQRKGKKVFKNNITISIAQQNAFTVVLMMKGGIDRKFFQIFDFGN